MANYKKTNLFRNSISVNGIVNMHVMAVDQSKTQLEKFYIPHDESEIRHKHREEQTEMLR